MLDRNGAAFTAATRTAVLAAAVQAERAGQSGDLTCNSSGLTVLASGTAGTPGTTDTARTGVSLAVDRCGVTAVSTCTPIGSGADAVASVASIASGGCSSGIG